MRSQSKARLHHALQRLADGVCQYSQAEGGRCPYTGHLVLCVHNTCPGRD